MRYDGRILIACVAAAGFVLSPGASMAEGPPAAQESAALVTQNSLDALRDRLAALNKDGQRSASYYFTQARAWLDFAVHEYSENDRDTAREIVQRVGRLIDAIESGTPRENSFASGVSPETMARADLVARIAGYKQHPGFRCAEHDVARLEVILVRAAHEESELGWRNANQYLREAECLVGEIGKKLANCMVAIPSPEPVHISAPPVVMEAPVTAPPVVTEAPVVVSPPVPEPPIAELIQQLEQISDSVHFGVDSAILRADSSAILDRIADIMMKHPELTIELQGHADQRGDEEYNRILSRRRVESVKARLTWMGVEADRITITIFGKSKLKSAVRDKTGHAQNRRVEFVFSGVEGLQVVQQESDLQLENGRTGKKRKLRSSVREAR